MSVAVLGLSIQIDAARQPTGLQIPQKILGIGYSQPYCRLKKQYLYASHRAALLKSMY